MADEKTPARRRSSNAELLAMARMERHLEGLTPDAQRRVVAYLQSKVEYGAMRASGADGPKGDPRQLSLTQHVLRPPPVGMRMELDE